MYPMFARICFTFLIAGLFSVTFATAQAPPPTPAKANARPTPTPAPPAIEPFDKADVKTMASKCVTLDTEAGSIVLEMYPESAPESVRNFLNLVATGAYDTTTFSRVVPGFVIQGGDLYTRVGKLTYALGMIHSALNQRTNFDPAASERAFVIGMTDIGEIYFLPKLMEYLRQHAPRVTVSTVRNTTANLRDDLESGKVDLAIGLLPQLKAGFFQRRLFAQPYVCLMRKGHRLDKRKITLAEFSARWAALETFSVTSSRLRFISLTRRSRMLMMASAPIRDMASPEFRTLLRATRVSTRPLTARGTATSKPKTSESRA